jgi:hypothetical protein
MATKEHESERETYFLIRENSWPFVVSNLLDEIGVRKKRDPGEPDPFMQNVT